MFIHVVLFEIKQAEVAKYKKDCRLWASYAKKAKGILGCYTVKRADFTGQYASIYCWKSRQDHNRFMDRLHDWLVTKSKARVKVLGYYNFMAV